MFTWHQAKYVLEMPHCASQCKMLGYTVNGCRGRGGCCVVSVGAGQLGQGHIPHMGQAEERGTTLT